MKEMDRKEFESELFKYIPESYENYPDIKNVVYGAVMKLIKDREDEFLDNLATLLYMGIEAESMDMVEKGILDICVDDEGEIVFVEKKGRK